MMKLRLNVAGNLIVKRMNENDDTWENQSKFHLVSLTVQVQSYSCFSKY
jgi:hypothetical protein